MSSSWIQTFKGNQFDLLNPSPSQVDIQEIAHALSLLCRFTGHVGRFYSVAQHCVIVSQLLEPDTELAFTGLLHDAAEAYIGDVNRPLKQLLPEYHKIENSIEQVIAARFGTTWPMPAEVKQADNIALMWERRTLMSEPPQPWMEEGLLALVPEADFEQLDPAAAEQLFLDRFSNLWNVTGRIGIRHPGETGLSGRLTVLSVEALSGRDDNATAVQIEQPVGSTTASRRALAAASRLASRCVHRTGNGRPVARLSSYDLDGQGAGPVLTFVVTA